jgi:hypothetical protein
MREKHVVSALIEKRASLAGELRKKRAEVRRLKRALGGLTSAFACSRRISTRRRLSQR